MQRDCHPEQNAMQRAACGIRQRCCITLLVGAAHDLIQHDLMQHDLMQHDKMAALKLKD